MQHRARNVLASLVEDEVIQETFEPPSTPMVTLSPDGTPPEADEDDEASVIESLVDDETPVPEQPSDAWVALEGGDIDPVKAISELEENGIEARVENGVLQVLQKHADAALAILEPAEQLGVGETAEELPL